MTTILVTASPTSNPPVEPRVFHEASPFATGPDNKAHYKRARAHIRERLKLRKAAHRAYHVIMAKPHDSAQNLERSAFLYGGGVCNPHYGDFALSLIHAAYCLLRNRAFVTGFTHPSTPFAHGVSVHTARHTLDRILVLTREQSDS